MCNSEIWEDDLLGRKKDADFLIHLLLTKSTQMANTPESPSYVINIDQGWGAGKTFFLTRMRKQLENDGHATCYINAWEDDFSEDPMIPIIASLDRQLLAIGHETSEKWKLAKSHLFVLAKAFGKHAAIGIVNKITGISLPEIAEELDIKDDIVNISEKASSEATDKILSNFRKNKKHFNEFKSAFSAVTKSLRDSGHNGPLFILIDELDRCKPTYAITLLERIKHLFAVEGAVFVIATDKQQLAHSISAVYGEKFDGSRYLRRFFDSTYHFTDPSMSDFVKLLLSSKNIPTEKIAAPFDTDIVEFIVNCAKSYSLTLRDLEQCLEYTSIITSLWRYTTKIQLAYLLPLIFSDYAGNTEEFKQLCSRELGQWFINWEKDRKDISSNFYFTSTYLDRSTHSYKTSRIDFPNYLTELLDKSGRDLHKLAELSQQGPLNGPIYRLLHEEYMYDILPQSSRDGTAEYSRILQYPVYVRNARHLTSE
ncbi:MULTISPECIES: P-loop NTPase fold protein [unclassified Thalassospira]|uniref:KAP family P-loop NTPase fold protein n=1 Tax=unclassified Thalassospira TaxID=2648997 RepID=UPI001B2C5D8A|nr:P-loop NTPase fold protein [Thalassospira sp.]MBO6773096.1 hypothetical protein [Thalassospira sp.]